MKPLVRATLLESDIQQTIESTLEVWRRNAGDVRTTMLPGITTEHAARAAIREHVLDEQRNAAVWINDVYQVHVRDCGEIVHLSVRRLDRAPARDWRDMQAIKNQLVGPENEGVELYPAESRLVDTANQFHIWVIKDPSVRFPIGFLGARFVQSDSIGKQKQRPHE